MASATSVAAAVSSMGAPLALRQRAANAAGEDGTGAFARGRSGCMVGGCGRCGCYGLLGADPIRFHRERPEQPDEADERLDEGEVAVVLAETARDGARRSGRD